MTRNDRQVPDGWQVVRLGDVACERNQRADSAQQTEVFSVTKHAGFVRSLEYFDRQVFSRDTSNYKVVRRGDLAYATIHLDEGSLGILRDADTGIISPMYTVFEVDRERTQPEFLFSLMKLPQMVARYQRIGEGTVHRRKSISFKRLARLRYAIPPLIEQQRILAVLDSIDEAIERSEAVIAANERLRDALLHELLTRGVRGWHTEWKDVPGIGTIPADWGVVRLGDVATLQRGMDLPIQDRRRGLVPVFGSNGILDTHDRTIHSGPGVITGRSGSIGEVYFSAGPYWPLNTTLYVRDFHGNCERFIFHLLSHLRLERFAASTGVPSLNRNFVHPTPVPVPPLHEQQAIASTLDSVQSAIKTARLAQNAVQSIKESSSDALLTGRMRSRYRQQRTFGK